MKKDTIYKLVCLFLIVGCTANKEENTFKVSDVNTLYKAVPEGVKTLWFSSENKGGIKGKGGQTNKGAKGDAFTMIGPGDKTVILDYQGAGMITKIWSANSTQWSEENRRKLSINMYWDNEIKPAVSVPFSDFFLELVWV